MLLVHIIFNNKNNLLKFKFIQIYKKCINPMIGILPNRTPHAIKQVHMTIEVNSFPSIIFPANTLSVPRELATTWVTCSSIWLVHTAPNCCAVCHNGCRWGLASPTGKTRLNTMRQLDNIFRCSAARMFLTSTSFRDRWEKKSWWILSITCSKGKC